MSLKKQILTQLTYIKTTIEANVKTLQSLSEHSESLTSIISGLSDTSEVENKKHELESIKNRINEDIKDLTAKTSELFTRYKELIETLFK